MNYDKIELKWGAFDVITNSKGDEFFSLIRYKEEKENLGDFLEKEKKLKNHIALRYYINGKDFADYLNSMNGYAILEVSPHYFNTLSFNLHPKSIWFDKDLAWERITLKRLLGYPIIQDEIGFYYIDPRHKLSEEEYRKSIEKQHLDGRVYLYGCGCKDPLCGGWFINVNLDENSFFWDICIRNHRKYIFERTQYLEAFQEIKVYIENFTHKLL
jgi:hypothetical protein